MKCIIRLTEAGEREGWGVMGTKLLFGDDEKWIVVIVRHGEYTSCYWTVYLDMVKMVKFVLCLFYDKKTDKPQSNSRTEHFLKIRDLKKF